MDWYKTIIVSGANADKGGKAINRQWMAYPTSYVYYAKTYPHRLWISLMHHADVLIGNSSGFIIEGMTMGKKFINIGDRQKGRYEDALEFFPTLNERYGEDYIDPKSFYPYGVPGTVGEKIAEILATIEIPDKPRKVLYAE